MKVDRKYFIQKFKFIQEKHAGRSNTLLVPAKACWHIKTVYEITKLIVKFLTLLPPLLWRKWYKQLTTVKIHILVRPNYDLTSFLNEEIEICLFCRNYPHLFRSSVIDFYTLCYFLEPVWWQTIVKKEMRFFSNIDLLTRHFLSPGRANFPHSELGPIRVRRGNETITCFLSSFILLTNGRLFSATRHVVRV